MSRKHRKYPGYSNTKLIRNWEELAEYAKLDESPTHYLEIGEYNGHIKSKTNPDDYGYYLSTHTFYGSQYKYSTHVLQRCGFKIHLENWDKEGQNGKQWAGQAFE